MISPCLGLITRSNCTIKGRREVFTEVTADEDTRVKVLFNGRRSWETWTEHLLPALPVGTAAAAFPDILFSWATELKMKKRVLLRTKHQMLQVCGGGLVQCLHQMMHLTTVWLNLMECFHRCDSAHTRRQPSASATDLIRNSLPLVSYSLFCPPFTDPTPQASRRLGRGIRLQEDVGMFWPIFLSAYDQKYVLGVYLVAENLTS